MRSKLLKLELHLSEAQKIILEHSQQIKKAILKRLSKLPVATVIYPRQRALRERS